jgi:sulfur carrier protein ThiS
MEVIIDNRKQEIGFSGDISSLLKELGLMREEVVVKVNGRLAPDTKTLSDMDKVEVIKVVFGG